MGFREQDYLILRLLLQVKNSTRSEQFILAVKFERENQNKPEALGTQSLWSLGCKNRAIEVQVTARLYWAKPQKFGSWKVLQISNDGSMRGEL